MNMLLFGTFAVAGVGLGWYGHKAILRIEDWGRKANERDLIFQQMSEGEDGNKNWVAGGRKLEEVSAVASMVNPHFPVAAAASK